MLICLSHYQISLEASLKQCLFQYTSSTGCLSLSHIYSLFIDKDESAGYGAQTGEQINPYSVLVEIDEENVEGSGMEDTGLVGVEWIHMAQDAVQ